MIQLLALEPFVSIILRLPSTFIDLILGEIYLMPFMLAEKLAKPWSYMTAYVYSIVPCILTQPSLRYNRVNGTHVSESPLILKDILRDEWKFDGMVRIGFHSPV